MTTFDQILAWLVRQVGGWLGYENVTEIESVEVDFAASWAQGNGSYWLMLGCIALCIFSWLFYMGYQDRGRRRVRALLATGRAAILCLLFLILADPILEIKLTSHPRPLFWILFDGSDSMAIRDKLSSADRERLAQAVDLDETKIAPSDGDEEKTPTRADYVRALVSKDEDNLLTKLTEKFRLQAYVFDDASGTARPLKLSKDDGEELDPEHVAEQLTTTGEISAIGGAFEDLALRHSTRNLAGMLVVSDFQENGPVAPDAAVKKLGAKTKVFTLGVGPRTAKDLEVKLEAPLRMKKNEESTLTVRLDQTDLDDEQVNVRVIAKRIDDVSRADAEEILVGEKQVALDARIVTADFPFEPEDSGNYLFVAQVEPLEGEVVEANNVSERSVTVLDDFMRLMFVEQEPTWEWRFVKEVFHRDKLVGLRGFRTFLRSADPKVKDSNELYLPSLTPPRRDFFKYDVIFIGDIEGSKLSTRFCEMTHEFVSKFGGGLVVISGPQFGPSELVGTPLADMLPVIIDPDARLRDNREFRMKSTPMASNYPFMQLGADKEEDAKAWYNMGELPWYQPVKAIEPTSSIVLAEHPTDTCADGKTPQPLIAIRKLGRGEVIWLAMDEMWRLRRKYGEMYYRQFWGQMIHRLGLSHALGSQKRFVVSSDQQKYSADEKVVITVEAYNEDFKPLTADDFPDQTLKARLVRPTSDGGEETEEISISQRSAGIYEVRIPVFEGGEYRMSVTDPITNEDSEVRFEVKSVSAERMKAVRDFNVQESIAQATHAKSYELDSVSNLLEDFETEPLTETSLDIFPLWNTWLCFGLLVALLLGEWFVRKMVNLA